MKVKLNFYSQIAVTCCLNCVLCIICISVLVKNQLQGDNEFLKTSTGYCSHLLDMSSDIRLSCVSINLLSLSRLVNVFETQMNCLVLLIEPRKMVLIALVIIIHFIIIITLFIEFRCPKGSYKPMFYSKVQVFVIG